MLKKFSESSTEFSKCSVTETIKPNQALARPCNKSKQPQSIKQHSLFQRIHHVSLSLKNSMFVKMKKNPKENNLVLLPFRNWAPVSLRFCLDWKDRAFQGISLSLQSNFVVKTSNRTILRVKSYHAIGTMSQLGKNSGCQPESMWVIWSKEETVSLPLCGLGAQEVEKCCYMIWRISRLEAGFTYGRV